jgi:AAA15 family ATPase/GTPase
MSTLIKNLHIKNFKSVRDLSLECDRINIFIGKPNAGKSNILEAISLLGADYSENQFMEGFIRYKTIVQLFSNFDYSNPIQIVTNLDSAKLEFLEIEGNFQFSIGFIDEISRINFRKGISTSHTSMIFSPSGKIVGERLTIGRHSNIKKYNFSLLNEYKERGAYLFLYPPIGDNFYFIARSNTKLKDEIQRFLKPNGLDFLFDIESQQMAVIQKEKNSFLRIPMALVPDTFQRYIFHLAAIMSNRDSVLLFEEPESHSYPPYIHQLAQHIVDDEGGNQYFITTHNPYLLTPILQEAKDVALFVTWFEDYQTHARRLSEKEVGDILDYGMDVFLNLKHFIPHEPSPDFA